MPSARVIVTILPWLCLTLGPAPAAAQTGVGIRHEAWRSCLSGAFALRAALSGPALAADGALRACRDSESAYLDALSHSPLVDDEDVARVRPALLVRARDWLISRKSGRSL